MYVSVSVSDFDCFFQTLKLLAQCLCKKHELLNDVKTLVTIFQIFICSVLIKLHIMVYDHILNINQIKSELGTK